MLWAGLDGTESVRQHPVNINFVPFVSVFAFLAGRFSIKNNNKMTSYLFLPCQRTKHCWSTTPIIVGPNNVMTCYIRLHGTTTMLALVAYNLKLVKLFTQQVQTFLLFCDWQSVPQQCCIRLYGTPTMFFFSKNKQS